MLRTILSVSGKPGLYKLISQGKNMLILETLDANKKRLPVYAHDKVISLGDIAMYTDDEEVALGEVFESVKKKENGKENFIYRVTYACARMCSHILWHRWQQFL